MVEKINEKWQEEMPVLYEIAIFIQDELLEEYFQQYGYPEAKDQNGKSTIEISFDNAQTAQINFDLAQ